MVVNAYDTIRWHMESLSERLPPFKRVLSLELRKDPLPLTTTRKIKRFVVQREVLEKAARPAPAVADTPPETEVEERLFALIRGVKDAPAINPSMNLELDLGFTSLERVELLSAIQEALGIQVPEEEASKIHTVADLAGLVERLQLSGEAGPEDVRMADDVLRHRPALELLYFLTARVVSLLCRLLLRFRVEGVENLPAPPYLICPNHASYLDGFLMACAVPYRVSEIRLSSCQRRLLPGARDVPARALVENRHTEPRPGRPVGAAVGRRGPSPGHDPVRVS